MDLFAPADFDYALLRQRLMDAVAQGVYLGTSSWKYPGWLGTIYDAQRYLGRGGKVSEALFDRTCLAEYARLFPTVCVDGAYYRFPVVDDLLAMAAQVPNRFRFTFKVTDEITIQHFPRLPKFGKKGGTDNPEFLNVDLFSRMFLRPCESIAEKVGMLISECSPFDAYEMKQSSRIMESLSRFLAALPTVGSSPGMNLITAERNRRDSNFHGWRHRSGRERGERGSVVPHRKRNPSSPAAGIRCIGEVAEKA